MQAIFCRANIIDPLRQVMQPCLVTLIVQLCAKFT